MDRVSFEDEVDVRGGDLSRWPPALRCAAEALLAADPAARRLLDEMTAVEAALRASGAQLGADASVRRMAAYAGRGRQRRPLAKAAFRAGWTAAAAAVLVIGFAVGDILPDATADAGGLIGAALALPEAGDVD